MPDPELQKIKKDKTVLISDFYDSPQTSLLFFHFEPSNFQSSNERMKGAEINHLSIDNKDLYTFDKFFQKQDLEAFKDFFSKASYSKTSYGTAESLEKGEKPAYSMNTKERWTLFANPPPPIQEIHKLLSLLAYRLDADITTMPWELSHPTAGAPAVNPSVIVNYHNEGISKASMDYGKHQDCKPEKGIFFGIPVLYKKGNELHETHFVNGSTGKPWLVSLMLYSYSDDFSPEYGMGTVFYKADGELVGKVNCINGRLVLFEGDIFHSPEESQIPPDRKFWRISYVLKLIVNPKKENQNLKEDFLKLLRTWPLNVKERPLGAESRF